MQVGERIEAVHGPVLAAPPGGGAEDLDAQIAGEGPGGAADAGQEPLVGGLMAGLDPPGDRGGDRPVGVWRAAQGPRSSPTTTVVADQNGIGTNTRRQEGRWMNTATTRWLASPSSPRPPGALPRPLADCMIRRARVVGWP